MSLERGGGAREKKEGVFFKGAALGAAMLGAGGLGADEGTGSAMEQMNNRVLTPEIVLQLKSETNASDSDVANLEARLRPLLVQELKRAMDRKPDRPRS
jgi:hypothetical protein